VQKKGSARVFEDREAKGRLIGILFSLFEAYLTDVTQSEIDD
jgi:hypothetical protein